jgi:hypothetical protein
MAADASKVLGAPEVAGAFVNPKGMAKKMTASVAGQVVGGAAASFAVNMRTGGAYKGVPDVPEFGRVGYVAATESEIALVKTKTGPFKMKVGDEVLARAPRTEITSVELDEGWLSHLKIGFTNGVTWEFDIPKGGKKNGQSLVRALGGTFT